MAQTDSLATTRDGLLEDFESIQGTVILALIVFGCLIGTAGLIYLFDAITPNLAGDYALYIVRLKTACSVINITFSIIAPILLVPLVMDYVWQTNHRNALKLPRSTTLSTVVLDASHTNVVFEVMDRLPWLKLSGLREPQSIDERIEFASDYYWAVQLISQGKQDQLLTAVWWGSTIRLLDDIAVFVLNSCGMILMMSIGGVFFFTIGMPITLLWLYTYTKKQAVQTAMIDFYTD